MPRLVRALSPTVRLLGRLGPAQDAKRRRRRFLRSARGMTPYVATERAEGTFLLPTRGAGKLFANPRRTEFVVLARAIGALRQYGRRPRRGTIVDVGANIGTTTVAALTVHEFDQAVAIEPDPENVKLLRASIALNEIHDRVEVVPVAASARVGTATFRRKGQENGRNQIGAGRLSDRAADGADRASAAEEVPVETVSLDDLVEQGVIDPAQVTLLWLDVQGHEGEVLAGATTLVERHVPVVFALRPHLLSRSQALTDVLRRHYDTLIDLRSPTLKSGWEPKLEPIESLEERFDGRLTTDILAFARFPARG